MMGIAPGVEGREIEEGWCVRMEIREELWIWGDEVGSVDVWAGGRGYGAWGGASGITFQKLHTGHCYGSLIGPL